MKIFILSLIAPFVAVILGYLALREQAEVWPPPGSPELPGALWASTGLLLGASGLVHWSLRAVRRDAHGQLRTALVLACTVACAFMVTQSIAWFGLLEFHRDTGGERRIFASTFYILTGLHAVHVVGGMALLAVVTIKSFLGKYWSYHHPGVLYNTMYWHFLDGVWIVLFVVLEVGSIRA